MRLVSVVIRIDGKAAYVFKAIAKLAEARPDMTVKQILEANHRN